MAVNIKAREIALRFNNGTDAIAFDPTELNYYTEPISPTGLIRMQGSVVLDPTIATLQETLNPDTNPNGRWNEGVSIECDLGPDNFGTPTTHPAIQGAQIISKPWFREGERVESLEIEIGDQLSYLDNPVPVDDRSGVDIAGSGITLTQVINNHLVAGQTTALANTGPTTTTRRTWQTLDRQSPIATAGEIAFGSDNGPYFIWQDENGDNRIGEYTSAVTTPRFTITESQLAEDLTRVRTSESARRFEKLIARANLVEVDDCQFGNRTIAESFKTPNQIDSRYSDNTTLYLEYREEEDASLANNVYTRIVTQTGLFRAGPPSPANWTNFTNSRETTVDTFNSNGLLSSRVITKEAALILSPSSTELLVVERTTLTYTYDSTLTLTSILTEYEKPVIVTGIGLVLFDPTVHDSSLAFLAKVGEDIEDYNKTNCGFDRTIIARASNIASGSSSYQILFTPTKQQGTVPVPRPPAPGTIPRPTLKETPIEAECVIFPPNGNPPDKIRETSVTLRFVSSQAALQSACDWIARQMWQKPTTYRVVLPYLDVIRSATSSPNSPFFSFDLIRDDGSRLRLLWDDVEYVFDQKETKVIVKAQLIAEVVGATVTPPFRIPLNGQTAVGIGSATDAGFANSALSFLPDTASGTGTANDATFTLLINFSGDSADGVGTANDATFSNTGAPFSGDTASGVGTVNDATFSRAFGGETASGTGTANDAALNNSAFAGDTASGTGTANDATFADNSVLSWIDITDSQWIDMTDSQWIDIQD